MLPLRMLGPLMLMVLLSDAKTSCPDDSKLLSLDPPKLIAEYNEAVSVNCSSTEILESLTWKIGDTVTVEMEEDGFVTWSTSLSDWNVKAECIIQLNDTFECSRNLEITIYQTPDKVLVTPLNSDPMVEGKPYQLRCEIGNVAPVQNLKVRWFKDQLMFYTQTINETSVTPISVSTIVEIPPGQLRSGADFRCEAELDFGPEGPNVVRVTSQPYTADEHYKPLFEGCAGLYSLVENLDTLDMLPCLVRGNPPPTVRWYYKGNEIDASEPLDRSHAGEYTVEASNSVGTSNFSVNITIKYKPLIGSCAGEYYLMANVETLNMLPCRAHGNPPPTVRWYYKGKEINASEPLDRTHSGKYTVEVSNIVGRSSFSVSVTIDYAPEFENITDKVFVDEGTNFTLTCDAYGNPPPEFSWTVDGRTVSEDGAELNISRVMTSANYTCTATNMRGNMTKQIYVHVTNTEKPADPVAMNNPDDPTIKGCPLTLTPAEIVVRFGDPVSINCSTSATEAVGMGWEAAFGGTDFKKNTTTVIWKVDKLEEWTIEPKCYVTQSNSKQCIVKPAVTVYKTPEVSLSAYNPMVEGTMYQLGCKINNVAPVQNLTVKWYRDNDMIQARQFDQTSVIPVNVSSTLSVTAERDHSGAVFKCKAELHLGPKGPESIPTVTSTPFTADVHYMPQIQNCSGDHSLVENKDNLAMLPCQFDGNPASSVQWYYQGKEMNATEPLNRAHSGKYTVVASNSIGNSSISVHITVEYGPSFACKNHYKVHKDANVQTTCEVKGSPPPVIKWFKDGGNELTSDYWTKDDSGKYSLTATNTHGKAYHELSIDVLYAPMFSEGNYTKEVATGENVTLSCGAEGNPSPEIQWNIKDVNSSMNVMMTTRGRQRDIYITRATSTNTAVYICTATNKVGTVTKSVTLIVKDKISGIPPYVPWVFLIIAIIVIVVLLIIIYRIRRRKQGQYHFVSDKAKDELDIPMTAKSNGVQA